MSQKKFNVLGSALLCNDVPAKELRTYFGAPSDGIFLNLYCKGTPQNFRQNKIVVAVAEKMISEAKGSLLGLFAELCMFGEEATGAIMPSIERELVNFINNMSYCKVGIAQNTLNPLGRAMLLANASVDVLWKYFGVENKNQYNMFCRYSAYEIASKNITVSILSEMTRQAKGTILHNFVQVCNFHKEAISKPLTDKELQILGIISQMEVRKVTL